MQNITINKQFSHFSKYDFIGNYSNKVLLCTVTFSRMPMHLDQVLSYSR